MNEQQFNEITKWQKKTFPESNVRSKLSHLQDEIMELKESIALSHIHVAKLFQEQKFEEAALYNTNKRLEFADCFILLFGAANADKMTYSDIVSAIDEKMAINRQRKWGTPNKGGIVNHIKPGSHE
jgi:enoyl reductase-like protein